MQEIKKKGVDFVDYVIFDRSKGVLRIHFSHRVQFVPRDGVWQIFEKVPTLKILNLCAKSCGVEGFIATLKLTNFYFLRLFNNRL